MKLMRTSAAAAAVFAISAFAASAATFDFGQLAEDFDNTNSFEGTFAQVADYEDDGLFNGSTDELTDGGISVGASATGSGDLGGDPFMDSISGGELAGLGVCSSGDSPDSSGIEGTGPVSACSTGFEPSSANGDDNLLSPEMLTLTFSGVGDQFSITDLIIRDADHLLITDENAIKINGVNYAAVDGVVLGLEALANVDVYTFTSTNALPEIYLSVLSVNEVPVPAAGLLLLGGLGGLAAMKRRKKKAA